MVSASQVILSTSDGIKCQYCVLPSFLAASALLPSLRVENLHLVEWLKYSLWDKPDVCSELYLGSVQVCHSV